MDLPLLQELLEANLSAIGSRAELVERVRHQHPSLDERLETLE